MMPIRPPLPGSTCRQCGLSLIELMIAMAIGLFLSLAMSVVYLYMKQAFNSQDQLAQLQDNERLALTILTTSVKTAGYYPDPLVLNAQATNLPTATGTYAFAQGQGMVGTTGATSNGDALATRYVSLSGDGVMDCTGTPYVGGTLNVSKQLMVNLFRVNTSNELTCAVSGDGVTFGTAVPLVSNVKSMTVLYGIDTTGSGSPDRYYTASAVPSWAAVKTALVTLSFVNPFAGQPLQPATINWTHTVALMNSR